LKLFLIWKNFNPNVPARYKEGINFAADALPNIFQNSPTFCTAQWVGGLSLTALFDGLMVL
jgi:hypothetical protein